MPQPSTLNPQPINLAASEEVRQALSSKNFRVRQQSREDGTLELLVMGVIGDDQDGLDARSVAELLTENRGRPVLVRINTIGGLAFDGITIHNALVNHDGQVTVLIEGSAASAGAVIAAAGDPVRMAANAEIFIHRAWGVAVGNSKAFEDIAEWLGKIDVAIAKTFAAKSGQTAEKMLELLDGKVDGTTLDAEEAKALGLVDEIVPIRGGSEAENSGQGSGVRSQESDQVRAALAKEADERLLARQRLLDLEAGG